MRWLPLIKLKAVCLSHAYMYACSSILTLYFQNQQIISTLYKLEL